MQTYKKQYNKEIQKIQEENVIPTLLLHSCCGPCSSAVLEELTKHFLVTILYYNPNIYPKEEYLHRKSEQLRLIKEMKFENKVSFIDSNYDISQYDNAVIGHENDKEGEYRCHECYKFRLEETAKVAKEKSFDYFTSTLSVSPYKNATWINDIGVDLSKKYEIKWLTSDFKKNEGYKRSIELSKEYDLYRQDYCGCKYSLEEKSKEHA